MSFSDAPISFPGLFGDWQFTVPSKALNIGNGIYWYGIIIAAGMLLGLYFCMKQAPKYGLSEDNIIDTVLWVIPFSIIGARIYYVLFYLDLFRGSDGSINWSSTYRIWDGGLAIYGGVIAGTITIYVVAKVKKINPAKMLDMVAPGVMIGQAIGRWGNFMNGEAHGGVTDLPWRMGLRNAYSDSTIYVHPTFLYESLWNVIGFIILNILYKKKKFGGEIALMYIIWYGIGRTFIEGLRTDSLLVGNTGLRASQLVAIGSVIVAAMLLIIGLRNAKGKQLQVTLAVSDIKKQAEAGNRFTPDTLPANAPHADFVKATDEMNRRLKDLDLDAPEIEELEDPAPKTTEAPKPTENAAVEAEAPAEPEEQRKTEPAEEASADPEAEPAAETQAEKTAPEEK